MKKETNPDKVESNAFDEVLKGAHATVEYAGLVSWSIISRGSVAVRDEILKFSGPVGRNAAAPFLAIRDKIRNPFAGLMSPAADRPYIDKKIKGIEGRIKRLEERLAALEKYGVRMADKPEYQRKKKDLDDERKGLIDMMVEENKRLRRELKASS